MACIATELLLSLMNQVLVSVFQIGKKGPAEKHISVCFYTSSSSTMIL
jgi:hypothetical protein